MNNRKQTRGRKFKMVRNKKNGKMRKVKYCKLPVIDKSLFGNFKIDG